MTTKTLSTKAAVALGALMRHIAPVLAQDAKVDLGPALEGVTGKNFAERKAAIAEGVQAAVKGKLAKDASLEDLTGLLDAVGSHKDSDGDEGEDADEPAAGGEGAATSAQQACAFLKDKLSPEDYAAVEKLLAGGAQDGAGGPPAFPGKPKVGGAMDESPEAKAAREKAEKDAKIAQDAATASAVSEAVAAERARAKGVAEAVAAIRPYVGEIAMDGIETGTDAYRAALKGLKVDVTGVHESAFPALLKAQKKVEPAKIAQDGDDTKSYAERFPQVARLS